MRRSKAAGLGKGLRIAALLLATVVAGGRCLQGAAENPALLGRAGALSFTFFAAPGPAGDALQKSLQGQTDVQPPQPAAAPQNTVQQQVQSPAEVSAASPVLPTPVTPSSPDTAGWLPVRAVQYPAAGAGVRYISLAAGSVRNLTSYSADQVRQTLSQEGLPFAVQLNSTQPQVLIMHTHATECYAETDGLVDPANNGRTTDTAANMVAVGDVLTQTLNDAGIYTVHDATLHDYPSYNGSYDRSKATVESWLAQYPSIRVVLDVHRDAIETDGVRIKPTAEINGIKAAQLMIISGADDGTMGMPHFWQNLRFAAALQTAVESANPGLTRPVLFDYRNYNQQLTTGSLLLEVGGHGNTLEEAKYTARLVGLALADLLIQNAVP